MTQSPRPELTGLFAKYTKPYEPKEVEGVAYKKEVDSGYFNPDRLPERFSNGATWTTIMPPPNANGRLHAGHALDSTLKDVIGRYMRMRGNRVLILPGTDHAGFETQVVYEKKLEKEGRTRFGMDKDQLYKEIYDFTLSNKHIVMEEVKRIGVSADWSRETFTLDPKVVSGVQDTFIKMYKDGLVYRGKRDCNWCSKHQTSLSDVETTSKEFSTPFYTFKIGEFEIGTARPETKFGDKYIVVHPDDVRYVKWKQGDQFTAEWINGPQTFTIVKDNCIDMEFGTGAMTITPWHSSIDFQIAQRHGLDMVQVIDEYGKLTDVAGPLKGLKATTEGRKQVVEILKNKGLVVKVDVAYKNIIPVCYKCETPIEPQLRDQWFVKMAPLAERALKASQDGELVFVSEQFKKIYEYWMGNPIDWNISRQIVWGIPIPAWFKNKGTSEEESVVSKECPGEGWTQDADTFDTWFSSGQWPIATLGFTEGEDFKKFYPTQLMETGRDLVFKWVPRMVIFGLYLTDKVPFRDVYFHGMVLDPKGQKMSKSKGNVLSPIEVADTYGMDALRMALLVGNAPGNDMPLSEEKVKAYKKFINKLWNIARFVFENTSEIDVGGQIDEVFLETKKEIEKQIESYQLHMASEALYHYIWHHFADVVIEDVKKVLNSDADEETKSKQRAYLRTTFEGILKLAHPFVPFVTEEIWSDMGKMGLLMVEEW